MQCCGCGEWWWWYVRAGLSVCFCVVAEFQYSFALSWWSSFSYATHIPGPISSHFSHSLHRHIIYSMATNICRVSNDSLSLRISKHVCASTLAAPNCLHCGKGKYVRRDIIDWWPYIHVMYLLPLANPLSFLFDGNSPRMEVLVLISLS